MSPEQLEGKDVDARTDVLALGAVLYEMVTGRKAFQGESQASLISAIMTSDPEAPSAQQPLSPLHLDAVISNCLAKDPDQRWQSAADVARVLRWVGFASSPVSSTAGSRSRLAWGLVAVLALASLPLAALLVIAPGAGSALTRFHVPLPEGTAFAVDLIVSPDGRRLVFRAVDTEGTSSLWLRTLDALDSQPLAGTEGGDQPFWSPDGRSVAFFADGKLKKLALDGGRVEILCDAGSGRGGTWVGTVSSSLRPRNARASSGSRRREAWRSPSRRSTPNTAWSGITGPLFFPTATVISIRSSPKTTWESTPAHSTRPSENWCSSSNP